MMPEGVIRTRMGVYLLPDDLGLSQCIGDLGRLDDNETYGEVVQYAHLIPLGGVVVNAGASLGDHVEIYSRLVGGDGHVYAFEPHSRACAALRLNMARLNNVSVFEYALGYQSGTVMFSESCMQGCSTILPPDCTAVTRYEGEIVSRNPDVPVAITTLDEYLLPSLTRCDFIHFDTEGTEAHALIGAQEVIRRFRPILVIEVGQTHLTRWGLTPEKVLGLLTTLGYTLSDLNDLPDSGPDGRHGRVWNVLAMPIPDFIAPKIVPVFSSLPSVEIESHAPALSRASV